MRIHLLALPNTQTTKAYSLDGFCMATINFAKICRELGYHVTLYASEENEAPCDELVTVITKEEQQTILGDEIPYQYAQVISKAYPLWALANNRTVHEIAKRKQPRDVICTIGGASQIAISAAHPDLMTVEYSIGYVHNYGTVCRSFRVFESHCWRSMSHGYAEVGEPAQAEWDGRFFDAVIPLFFDPSEFRFNAQKEPFALFVGRLIEKKGITTACRAAEMAGIPLKVIGHGDTDLVTHGAELLGTLGWRERNEWLSRASVLICPTTYVEPFGAMAVEAQLCGTPAVTTDFGAFVETVEQGKTGYRCIQLGEFAHALELAQHLDPHYIHERAVRLYSIHTVKEQYRTYFERLMLLWEDGWESRRSMLQPPALGQLEAAAC